jgi:type IV pilus assembly protein PilM
LFARRRPPLIGIDISASAVKVLELGKAGAEYCVRHYAVEPLPPSAVVEHKITDVEQVAQTVAQTVKRSGTRYKHVAVAVPAAHVITKVVKMPDHLSDQERLAQIELDADRYIPYPLDEANLDFQVLGASEANPEDVDVLMAACRKEIVDDYLAVIQMAGLTPAVVDVETYAVENAYALIAEYLPGKAQGKLVAIVDIGSAVTTVNVMHNNRSVYTRDHVFGGRQLTEEIQRRYGLSYAEAGLAKRRGGLPDSYQTDVLQPFMEAVSLEVRRALQFFYSSTPFNKADKILLAGGCSQIAGIEKLVAARTGIPALVADPFSGMVFAAGIKSASIHKQAPSLMVACGLALRSFDT